MTQDRNLEVIEGNRLPAQQQITARDFQIALEDGEQKAQLIGRLVETRKLFQQIGPKRHPFVEAWVTVAAAYGLHPSVEWSRPLPNGGWEARAVLLDQSGNTIAGAEAECGTEGDKNWTGRASFQQRSMAETRAVSKVCRLNLSWVMVLAGFDATPAEEVDRETGEIKPASRQTQGRPQARPAASVAEQPAPWSAETWAKLVTWATSQDVGYADEKAVLGALGVKTRAEAEVMFPGPKVAQNELLKLKG